MNAARSLLGWRSPLLPVWLWHAMFDGSRLCPCPRSARYRQAIERENLIGQAGEG